MFAIVCGSAGLFGILVILVAFFTSFSGLASAWSTSFAALKIGGAFVRGFFLLACGWAGWADPPHAAWFAWGACFTFMLSGAADEVYRRGIIKGFGNLMSTYYLVSLAHALLAVAVSILTPESELAATAAEGLI